MILTYHEIEPRFSGDLYRVTSENLEKHLGFLAELRSQGTSEPDEVPVTFDDGHLSNYHYGVPLLQKYALQAIFFVPAGWVGVKKTVMEWEQIRELLRLGYQVQSHTWSHPLLTHCSDSRLQTELKGSRQTLEDKLGVAVEKLSVPYGRWDRRVLCACAQAGYKQVYTSDPWLCMKRLGLLNLSGRLTVRSTTGSAQLRRFLEAKGPSLFALRAPHLIKQDVRQLLGDGVYHRLWCRFARRDEPRGDGL